MAKINLISLKNSRIWLLTVVICSCLFLSANAHSEPTSVEANVTSSAIPEPARDTVIEAELEGTLGVGFVPRDRTKFETVLAKITNATPIETYVRGQGYQVLTLAIADDNLPAAVALGEDILAKALASGNANAIAEAYIILAEAYLQKDEIDAAKNLISDIEEYSAAVTNPRVQYHAKHLTARTLIRFEEFGRALEYMLDAQLQAQRLSEQQRTQKYTIAIGLLLVIIIFLTAYAYRKSRKVNQLLNRANHELNEQSLRDPLTSLFNRRAVQKRFLDERRTYQGTHGLFLIDVDYFKSVNDQYGHDVGDEILIEVSKRLIDITRENDMVIRWGGEEFLLIIENIDTASLSRFATKILRSVCQEKYETSKGALEITISGGAIPVSANQTNVIENWDESLKLADDLLYMSKENGRNQIHVREESHTTSIAIS